MFIISLFMGKAEENLLAPAIELSKIGPCKVSLNLKILLSPPLT